MTGIYRLSGTTTVIENLADQLGKKGVNVTISALKYLRIPPSGNYKVIKLPKNNLSKLFNTINSYDIMHNHHPIMNYFALFFHKPFIFHYHGAPDFRKRLYINMAKKAFDKVIAVSESGAMELKRFSGLNNIDIICNGVDTNLFKPSLDERFREGKPQFLFVGNLYKHKKIEELILAFKEVIKGYPKSHLQIIGTGYAYIILDNLIKKLHLQDHVTLVGRVSDFNLPFYYESCDVYVTSSRYETFGLSLLEAMACGKLVVASSIPPHIELLTKSKAGTTYKIGDLKDLSKKMIKIYEERNRYKNNAVRFAKKHNWSIIADSILKIYDELLDN